MRAESAIEIARASLALAFPDATQEGLTRAAELVVRWGSEGVGVSLAPDLAERMLQDLLAVTHQQPELFMGEREDEARADPAPYRVWTRPEEGEDLSPPMAPRRG
ncbi:hypothetical protein ACIGJO_34750 [Streptomyces sp. NPDC079020]|uniref:hypothetical protein n=1 Tax=Streptomyces sp. NPDC079020 TaxID=3365722 RepID=UPI0037D6A860